MLGPETDHKEVKEPYAGMLVTLKQVKIPIVSVDVPSGICSLNTQPDVLEGFCPWHSLVCSTTMKKEVTFSKYSSYLLEKENMFHEKGLNLFRGWFWLFLSDSAFQDIKALALAFFDALKKSSNTPTETNLKCLFLHTEHNLWNSSQLSICTVKSDSYILAFYKM